MCLKKSEFLFLVEWKSKGFIKEENIKLTWERSCRLCGGMARRKGIFKIRGIEWTVEGEKKYSSQNSYKITGEEGTILPGLF